MLVMGFSSADVCRADLGQKGLDLDAGKWMRGGGGWIVSGKVEPAVEEEGESAKYTKGRERVCDAYYETAQTCTHTRARVHPHTRMRTPRAHTHTRARTHDVSTG